MAGPLTGTIGGIAYSSSGVDVWHISEQTATLERIAEARMMTKRIKQLVATHYRQERS